MNLAAIVLHNVSEDTFDRYDPETSKLYHAHTFQIVADNTDQAAELIWTLTNVDDANMLASVRADLSLYGPQVTEYRRRKNRSLSKGDVVLLRELTEGVGLADLNERLSDRPDARAERPAGVRVVARYGWEALDDEPAHAAGSNKTGESLAYCAGLSRRR